MWLCSKVPHPPKQNPLMGNQDEAHRTDVDMNREMNEIESLREEIFSIF